MLVAAATEALNLMCSKKNDIIYIYIYIYMYIYIVYIYMLVAAATEALNLMCSKPKKKCVKTIFSKAKL